MNQFHNAINTARAISDELRQKVGPPEEGFASQEQRVIPKSVVRNTRGYIEKTVNQINGCYEKGWFDACAVMVRKLLETLIIESFEFHNIALKIKNTTGDFLQLQDLVNATLTEPSWNITRNSKQALRKLKDIGDKSAHNRRFVAQKNDVEPLLTSIRDAVQEFVFLAQLKDR